MTVFADSFAFLACVNPRDHFHEAVRNYLDAYVGRLVTTEWVLMEVADAFSAPQALGAAASFIRDIRSDTMFEVVGYEWAVYQAGFGLFAGRSDKAWSLTDCISFAVMTERALSEALTEDHHFEQAGF